MNNKFITLSSEQSQKQFKEQYLFNRILIYIKDKLPQKINIKNIIHKIEKLIPKQLTQGIDEIFIGHFDEFVQRDVNAIFLDGAIYITNRQSSNEDMINDIIHEIAHSVEETHGLYLYSDSLIENEFLSKRKKLFWILHSYYKERKIISNLKYEDFINIEYSQKFDKFLYKEIGYNKLSNLMLNLFASPYSITSLREYFANGFEKYFLNRDKHTLKNNSPMLYDKLDDLCYNL